MSGNRMPRSRRRPDRKQRFVRMLCIGGLAALLAVLGAFYIGRYCRQVEYARYPLKYRELIEETAETFELEPWHVAAVICCESGFRETAVSSVGARGMMQIMPDTGEWLAGKFGEESIYDPEMLFTPETNVKYGCWFLNWLMKRYDGDRTLATVAYHAGHGTLDKWLSDEEISPDGKTLSRIPYSSTAAYVERVLRACGKYQELYDWTEGRDAA